MAESTNRQAPSSGGLPGMASPQQLMKQSIGTEQNWGWSPAFDLLAHLPRGRLEGDVDEPINVLLDSAGDMRHVLMTLSRVRRHTERPVHFYVCEPNLKHHARHLFFLEWFFEQGDMTALAEAPAEFLELYGNTMLRETSYSTLKRVAKKTANAVRGGTDRLAGSIDLETFMKMREVDWVAEQLDAWCSEKTTFNVDVQWDNRVRADIGDRYDSKNNLMDWDFNTGVLAYTPHVRWPEYKDWRGSGIAYDWGRVNPKRNMKYEYTKPNKSLATFPDKKRSVGIYSGDVRCGPFCNIGIDVEWKDLSAKQQDGTFKYSNGVVAMHNIRSWLYEAMTGEPWEYSEFKLAWDAPDYEQEQKVKVLPGGDRPLPRFKYIGVGLDPARMNLLFETKLDVPVRFDVMFLSAQAAQNFDQTRAGFLKETGYLVVESLKFCVYMEAAQKKTFAEKVAALAAGQGWETAPELQRRLHHLSPDYHLPFARSSNPELSEAQKKVC